MDLASEAVDDKVQREVWFGFMEHATGRVEPTPLIERRNRTKKDFLFIVEFVFCSVIPPENTCLDIHLSLIHI